jgi:hypothetical protein
MKRAILAIAAAVALGLGTLVVAQNSGDPDAPIRADEAPPMVGAEKAPRDIPRGSTPMSERVATIAILNKRNGLSRDLRMRPGDRIRIGDAVVRLQACDQTEPWEAEQLTGAFVQLIARGSKDKWQKVFSGWLYKETPSLNVVQHPIFDVWVKDCTMRHPEAGPDSVIVSVAGEGGSSSRSNARKSADTDSAD